MDRHQVVLVLAVIFPAAVYAIFELVLEYPGATYYTLGAILISIIFIFLAKTSIKVEPKIHHNMKVSVVNLKKNTEKVIIGRHHGG